MTSKKMIKELVNIVDNAPLFRGCVRSYLRENDTGGFWAVCFVIEHKDALSYSDRIESMLKSLEGLNGYSETSGVSKHAYGKEGWLCMEIS